jgi:DNA repair protein RecN (Recombination protein N)
MLTELTISNFVIIDRQSLTFDEAFNVISGETGAGKSIILNALEFILGGKASPAMIRAGAEQLEVQALFDLSCIAESIRSDLPDIVGDDDELLVSRTLPREGRGKVLINGRLGTLSLLSEIVAKLVNICSQHHQTRLLDARYHLELLDGFCGNEGRVEEMRAVYREWSEKRSQLLKLKESLAATAARREELEQIDGELSGLTELRSGRRLELEREIKRIGSFERLLQSAHQVQELLGGDEGVSQRLKEISSLLHEMSRLDPGAAILVRDFEQACTGLLDSEFALSRYLSSLDIDASVLEDLRFELSEIARLERKYRRDDAGLCALRDEVQRELRGVATEGGLHELQKELDEVRSRVDTLGATLRKERQAGAKRLCTAVEADLRELNMVDARVQVAFTPVEPCADGTDKVEFLIASNKGESFAPLSKIASGGELSRVMLVLKKILRERSGVNVLIFDEVDSGVSGGVARSVGLMLREIAQQSQVICITHLPQVASLSDRHFLVQKQVGDRAITVVSQLSDEEKVEEIARMLAGYKITASSRASARELIESKS